MDFVIEYHYEYNNHLNYNRLLFPDSFVNAFRKSDYNMTKRDNNENPIISTYEYTYADNGCPATIIEKDDGVLVSKEIIYYE